jgi:hypothetical protein
MALGEKEAFRKMFDEVAADQSKLEKKLFETKRPPFQELLAEPAIHCILTNQAFMTELCKLDFKDLSNYLATGTSPTLSDEILGRWYYDPEASVKAQKIRVNELAGGKIKWNSVVGRTVESNIVSGFKSALSSATLVGLMNNQLVIRATDGNRGTTTLRGTWSSLGGGKYEITMDGPWSRELELKGSRIKAKLKVGSERESRIVVFEQE